MKLLQHFTIYLLIKEAPRWYHAPDMMHPCPVRNYYLE
jgi:hypothetical protein